MSKRRSKQSGKLDWRQKRKGVHQQKRAGERIQMEAVKKLPAAEELGKPVALPWPPARRPIATPDKYRFLNPYNFVRFLPEPDIPEDDVDARLLGRCPPPPHDRYVGLTGRMICTLTAVTPLFIADSHDVQVTTLVDEKGKPREHRSYRFFQYDGQDAIPTSSLRGMIRSMFEIVTNSPFSVFNCEERLEYRIDPAEARRFKPGIVRSLPTDDVPGEITLCEEAKVGAYYEDPARNILDDSWECGEEAYAIVGKTRNNVPCVELLARAHHILGDDGRPVQHGWMKVTGKTIDTKRNESFFYFKGDQAKAKAVLFDRDREADFNTILHAQLHERSEDFHTRVQHERLTPGDLVYVGLDPDDSTRVRSIALTRVARLRYRNTIGDLLPDHLKPSERYEELDIASRLFGWVRGAHSRGSKTEDRKERIAYAGRLRLSHAILTEEGDKGTYQDELALAILGAPKPTTTLFYLHRHDGEWTEEERKQPGAADKIGYDGLNELRGWKVYRHHGSVLNRLEYERAGNDHQKRDHQNRSVRGVRAPGNGFRFTIDFHNLAPVELGALLWTLKLNEEGCCFRLGYAKPLGFGSVQIQVENVSLLDMDSRYAGLVRDGWRRATPGERSDWLYSFETAVACCYGKPIRQLDNIRDLFALLREPEANLPHHIHYPRSKPEPDPEGKNFEWFVANKVKSTKVEKAGPNLVLELAAEEESGLPLLSR